MEFSNRWISSRGWRRLFHFLEKISFDSTAFWDRLQHGAPPLFQQFQTAALYWKPAIATRPATKGEGVETILGPS